MKEETLDNIIRDLKNVNVMLPYLKESITELTKEKKRLFAALILTIALAFCSVTIMSVYYNYKLIDFVNQYEYSSTTIDQHAEGDSNNQTVGELP